MKNSTTTLDKQDIGTGFGDYQVIIYNDSHNTCIHVIMCLISVFGHSFELAKKIMMEAHRRGKAIAQVEGRDDAVRHCSQLIAFGITAKVEKF
jgi:ATP-dependent Clp protease adapter protein ClpS